MKRLLYILSILIIATMLLPISVSAGDTDVVNPKWTDLERRDGETIIMTKQIPVLNTFGETVYQTLMVFVLSNGGIWCEFGSTHFTISIPKPQQQFVAKDSKRASLQVGSVWYDLDNTKQDNKVTLEFRGTKSDGKLPITIIPEAGKDVWLDGKTMWVGTRDKTTGKALGAVGFNWDDALQTAIADVNTNTITFNVDSAKPFLVDPSIVVSIASIQYMNVVSYQRTTFYANTKHWVFYSNGGTVLWKTSADGISWSAATDTTVSSAGFSVYNDGTYVHITGCTGYVGIFYRRGLLNAAGTITWSAATQTAANEGVNMGAYSIIVDDGGHAIIGYENYPAYGDYTARVVRNDNTNGTWATTAGFPYELKNYGHNGGVLISLAAQTAGKFYAIYGHSTSATVYGKAYNAGWGGEDTIRNDKGTSYNYLLGSLTNYGDTLEYAYVVVTSNDIKCKTYSAGAWSGAVTVQAATTSTSTPNLASCTGDLVCFWTNSNHVYYKERISGSWAGSPTDWINEAAGIPANNYNVSSYAKYGGIVSYVYPSTAAPLDINYAFLSSVLATVTSDTASNVSCNTTTLNGSITATGGESADYYGFGYGTTSKAQPSSATSPAASAYGSNWTSGAGSYGVASYNHAATTLTAGTPYYYRFASHNSQGWAWSVAEQTFTTLTTPTIITNTVTDITVSTARLQSYLTNDGGAACQVRFAWGTTDNGTNMAAYNGTGSPSAWAGAYNTGQSPYLDVTTLLSNTTYYFNVQAQNGCGASTGASRSFKTESTVGSPSNVTAIPSYNSITLSWTKGVGAPNTIVRFMTNTCPTDNTTGTLIYGGTAATYLHTPLVSGTDYCYWLSGYDSAVGWSASAVTIHSTTLAGAAGADLFTTVPTQPTGWSQDPDPAVHSLNPLAPYIDATGNSIGMPLKWFWGFITLILMGLFAWIAYKMSHSEMAAMIAIILGSGIAGVAKLLPVYLAFVMGAVALTFLIFKLRSKAG